MKKASMNEHVGNELKEMKIFGLKIMKRKVFFWKKATANIHGHIDQNQITYGGC
jgi:hypothetical protein